jgi:two-component system, sensor histidine kinase PdtaS
MAADRTSRPKATISLALAMVDSSEAPLLLLEPSLKVVAASASFCRSFHLDPSSVSGRLISALGGGEWGSPQLRSLLDATCSGAADVEAYEMDLGTVGKPLRRLVIKARRLEFGKADEVRLLVTVSDVTGLREAETTKQDLLREKAALLERVHHRVVNSLQIIASVLLQNARRVGAEAGRTNLQDDHDRVMSMAAVQQQLTVSRLGVVELRPYFKQLCESLSASMIDASDLLMIEVDCAECVIDADTSVSLGLIVTELVINAVKHAFPTGRSGKISIDYHCRDSDWTLSVSDNGVGIDSDPEKARPGLGTSIVEALSRQLHADVEVFDAAPGTGVSVIHTKGVADGINAAAASAV